MCPRRARQKDVTNPKENTKGISDQIVLQDCSAHTRKHIPQVKPKELLSLPQTLSLTSVLCPCPYYTDLTRLQVTIAPKKKNDEDRVASTVLIHGPSQVPHSALRSKLKIVFVSSLISESYS